MVRASDGWGDVVPRPFASAPFKNPMPVAELPQWAPVGIEHLGERLAGVKCFVVLDCATFAKDGFDASRLQALEIAERDTMQQP
jgi:hypothetical protein